MAAPALISLQDFADLVAREMPFFTTMGLRLDALSRECAQLRAVHQDEFLRPGGTLSGPVMMGLADAAFYAVILANIGMQELAVTTSLNINFLRKPPAGDLLARARILKLGKRLVVCESHLYSEALGEAQAVAHATGTYSIPLR